MRSPPSAGDIFSAALVLLPTLTTAISIDCNHIREDKTNWNFQALAGPHSVSWTRDHPPGKLNTTFTLDICKALTRTSGADRADECPQGTRVCGIERYLSPDPDTPPVNEGTIPIAGAHTLSKGGDLDPKWTRLKTSPSHTDSQLEGLRLQIFGGKYAGRKQSAVVEFLCPGKEERRSDEGRRRGQSRDAAADDEADDREGGENEVDSDEEEIKEEIEDGAGGTISFLSYGEVATDDKEDVLRLKWTTPHACEDAINKPETGGSSGAQWGFFTWFIVIAFLATAAYLIFGSWMNYNRYGARGWDLLPHGDTIRDMPYLFRDFTRRVMDTLQGHGSRGGYSAV